MAIYEGGKNGKCPHCLTVVQFQNVSRSVVGQLTKEAMDLVVTTCPSCNRLIITGTQGNYNREYGTFTGLKENILWPTTINRAPVPIEVPKHIANDYKEAASTIAISPKASAALSRRCLQTILREAGNATQKDLSKQIDEVMPKLPSYISESIDHVRNIGNFAAHPIKDQSTGQIIEVEPGEAEWNLEVLDMLFDFYYVQPEITKQKRTALNNKLNAANKPPMK